MFLTSQIPRIFNDNFNSRNSVKGEIVALCLNVRDLRHLLKIEHENLEFIFPGCSDSKGKLYFYFIFSFKRQLQVWTRNTSRFFSAFQK